MGTFGSGARGSTRWERGLACCAGALGASVHGVPARAVAFPITRATGTTASVFGWCVLPPSFTAQRPAEHWSLGCWPLMAAPARRKVLLPHIGASRLQVSRVARGLFGTTIQRMPARTIAITITRTTGTTTSVFGWCALPTSTFALPITGTSRWLLLARSGAGRRMARGTSCPRVGLRSAGRIHKH